MRWKNERGDDRRVYPHQAAHHHLVHLPIHLAAVHHPIPVHLLQAIPVHQIKN